jgi:hypothetical protein
VKTQSEDGTSKGKALVVATQKRKIYVQGMEGEKMGPKASRIFVEELMGACAGPGEVMTSPELWETSSRMLKVTRGRCIGRTIYPVPPVMTILCPVWLMRRKSFLIGEILVLLCQQ